MAITAVSIRDTLTSRIKAISVGSMTTGAGAPRDSFRVYVGGHHILDDEPPAIVDRAFWVQIGESEMAGMPYTGSEQEWMTTFRVIVLYQPIANHELQEERVRTDALLLVNALRKEVSNEVSVNPTRIPEPERGATYWRLVLEGPGQHAETDWSGT